MEEFAGKKIIKEYVIPDPLTGGTVTVSHFDTGCIMIPDRCIPILKEGAHVPLLLERLKNTQITGYSEEFIDYRKRNEKT